MIDKEIAWIFLDEAEDVLRSWEKEFTEIKRSKSFEYALVFRAVHNLKGSSHAIGLDELASLLDRYETILDFLIDGDLKLLPHVIELIDQGILLVKSWLSELKTNIEFIPDRSVLLGRLDHVVDLVTRYKNGEKVDLSDFGQVALDVTSISKTDLDRAVSLQQRKLGEVMVDEGMISEADVSKILDTQEKIRIEHQIIPSFTDIEKREQSLLLLKHMELQALKLFQLGVKHFGKQDQKIFKDIIKEHKQMISLASKAHTLDLDTFLQHFFLKYPQFNLKVDSAKVQISSSTLKTIEESLLGYIEETLKLAEKENLDPLIFELHIKIEVFIDTVQLNLFTDIRGEKVMKEMTIVRPFDLFHGFLVCVNNVSFIVASSQVKKIVSARSVESLTENISLTVEGVEYFLVGQNETERKLSNDHFVLLSTLKNQYVALLVDEILGERDFILKQKNKKVKDIYAITDFNEEHLVIDFGSLTSDLIELADLHDIPEVL